MTKTKLMKNIETKVKEQYSKRVQSEINDEVKNNLREYFSGLRIEGMEYENTFVTFITGEDQKLKYSGTHRNDDSGKALDISHVEMDTPSLNRFDRLKKMPNTAYEKLIQSSYDIAQKLGYDTVTVNTKDKKEIDVLKKLGYRLIDNRYMKSI